MDLSQYVNDLQRHLGAAAAAGGEDALALAERLMAPLDSALRLVLLDALSDAVDEITSELAPGSVEVRLRGREPEFVLTLPPENPGPAAPGGGAVVLAPEADSGTAARTTLRLPEQLKARAEEAAGREGISVNTWLVRAVASALEPGATAPGARRGPATGQQFSGWVR